MLKQKYFLTGIFILSAERQPIKLAWRKIVWLQLISSKNKEIDWLKEEIKFLRGENEKLLRIVNERTFSL